MRAIVPTSLLLVLISLAGCQSNSVSYQVESQIGPHLDGPLQQCLVKITVIQVDPSGSRRLASPSTLVVLGEEANMSVERPDGTAIDCRVLIDQDKSFTSVSLSKNVNLISGIGMIVFGVFMLLISDLLKKKKKEEG